MSDIGEEVGAFILREILHRPDDATLERDLDLLTAGILDSLGLQTLVGFLEERYSVTIDDDSLLPENFETIGAIADMVSGLRARA